MKALQDPRNLYPKPPYSADRETPPGEEDDLKTPADHGEGTYQGHGLLEGMNALITGGDSGIGRAVALAYAREGANVAISYLSEHEDAKETERLVTSAGRRALLLPGNINTRAACESVAKDAIAGLGSIEILVNNAAYQRTYGDFQDIPDREFVECYEVNVFAMFRLCQFILPQMKPGSSIINTASIQSFDPSENLIAYASTKSAIVSFTKSLADLAIKHGVRVNAVAPGPVWTPLIPSTMPMEKVKAFGANTTFARAAQPAELAPLFVFLASGYASYVTGETYGATGGRMPL